MKTGPTLVPEDDAGRPGPSAWPWLLLGLAVAAFLLLRVPLILNAHSHIDSDLAVDGLTLLDATRGHWRWHYPGTPHIGTAPAFLGLPIALIGGVTPETLAVSGALIGAIGVVATFALAIRAFGRGVAAWSLVPMAFASTGTIWLSGRVTGGHLLAGAWQAGACLLAYETLSRGGRKRAGILGVWCGLGLWTDSMFATALLGLLPASVMAWLVSGRPRGGPRAAAVFALGFVFGLLPKGIGARSEPHDAYHEQFSPIWRGDVLREHVKILGLDCLPRLIVGHRLPGLEADPGGFSPEGQAILGTTGPGPTAWPVVVVGMGLFLVALPGLAFGRGDDPGRARLAVRWGLLGTTAGVLGAFVVSRNIFNSDNYRYLVFLLVPWAIGFGRVLDGLSRRGQGGAIAAGLIGTAFAASYAIDTIDWYRRLGWIEGGRVVARGADDPVLSWIEAHPEVDALYGGYWDVYRLGFLTGGRVKGIPSPHYPDRFPEWSRALPGGHPRFALVRPTRVGLAIGQQVGRDGGRLIQQLPGAAILSWP